MRVRLVTVIAVVAVLLAAAAPALAANSGTVGVTVNGASPCVTVSGQFDYGSMNFSSAGSISQSPVTAGPSITNCSGTTENYAAHMSNLANGANTWTPSGAWVNPCPTLNTFNVNVAGFGSGNYNLTSTDQAIGSSSSSTAIIWVSVFVMPCAGSSGAGLPMSGQITLTATF
jgi:hypothetical protein